MENSKGFFFAYETLKMTSVHLLRMNKIPSIRDRVHRNENFVEIIPV